MDAWVRRDQAGDMMGELLVGILAAKNPLIQEQAERDKRQKKAEAAIKRQMDNETATLLKAKLVQMRRQLPGP